MILAKYHSIGIYNGLILIFKLGKGITYIVKFVNQGHLTLHVFAFHSFLQKNTRYYMDDRFEVLQEYETYDVIISIIQYVNIFLKIHFGQHIWHMRKLLNEDSVRVFIINYQIINIILTSFY